MISTVITQSGWDHASLMPMVWLLLISPLLLTVLNWLMDPLIGLDLVLTNVPDLCDVHDHGNVFDVPRRVPLKSRVKWNAV